MQKKSRTRISQGPVVSAFVGGIRVWGRRGERSKQNKGRQKTLLKARVSISLRLGVSKGRAGVVETRVSFDSVQRQRMRR